MDDTNRPSNGRAPRDSRMAFFIMPTTLLRTLRDTASRHLRDEEKVRSLLFECGADCGRVMVRKMEISSDDKVDIGDTITALWIEIGLGRLSVKSAEEHELVVICDDSTEALANGDTGKMICDLTRGYLVGIASALTGFEWTCTEKSCLSHGDPECVYVLKAK